MEEVKVNAQRLIPSNRWYIYIYQNLNVSRLVLQLSLPNPLKPCIKSTGAAPTTSEWSILLPIKVRFILEVWQYFQQRTVVDSSPSSEKALVAKIFWCKG